MARYHGGKPKRRQGRQRNIVESDESFDSENQDDARRQRRHVSDGEARNPLGANSRTSKAVVRRRRRKMSVTSSLSDSESMPEGRDASEIIRSFLELPTKEELEAILIKHLEHAENTHFESLPNVVHAAKHIDPMSAHNSLQPPEDPFAGLGVDSNRPEGSACYSTVSGSTANFSNTIAFTDYQSEVGPVPTFHHYETLKDNLVAKNELELRAYPELPDEDDEYVLRKDLGRFFDTRNPDARRSQLPERAALRSLAPHLKAFLAESGSSFKELAAFLTGPSFPFGEDLPDHLKFLRDYINDRGDFCFHELQEPSQSHVSSQSSKAAVLACLCCKLILDKCKIRLWPTIEDHMFQEQDEVDDPKKIVSTMKFIASTQCHTCLVHDCPYHGEYTEESSAGEGRDELDAQRGDPWDQDYNYRKRVLHVIEDDKELQLPARNFTWVQTQAYGQLDTNKPKPKMSRKRPNQFEKMPQAYTNEDLCSTACFWKLSIRRTAPPTDWTDDEVAHLKTYLRYYASDLRAPCIIASAMEKTCVQVYQKSLEIASEVTTFISTPEKKTRQPATTQAHPPPVSTTKGVAKPSERGVFYPCNHEGTCADAQCSCWEKSIHCEKSCQCHEKCGRRWKGCTCHASGIACTFKDKCKCIEWLRECDPDLCGNCFAHKLLNPENVNEAELKEKCHNVSIQLGLHKRTLIGKSAVAPQGYGLFAGEPIKKHQMIGEYHGEFLSQEESARRGEPYHATRNYLFSRGPGNNIDGYHMSSKVRLINHAGNEAFQNCSCHYTLVNGVPRIAIWAAKDIEPGEELFYDYGYTEEYQVRHFREKDGEPSAKYLKIQMDFEKAEDKREAAAARKLEKQGGERLAPASKQGGEQIVTSGKQDGERQPKSGKQGGERLIKGRAVTPLKRPAVDDPEDDSYEDIPQDDSVEDEYQASDEDEMDVDDVVGPRRRQGQKRKHRKIA